MNLKQNYIIKNIGNNMLTPHTPKICIICKKKFLSAKKFKRGNSNLSKDVRQKNAITCSKICSRKLNYYSSKKRRELKNNKQ